jgi:nucleoside-diphosphate-sugar epimerase
MNRAVRRPIVVHLATLDLACHTGGHVVAEQAMTCRGLAAGVAAWFGREAVLDLVEWNEFERRVGSEHASATRDHIERSITASIERSRSILGYAPRYSSLEALQESLRWLVEHRQADVAGQAF